MRTPDGKRGAIEDFKELVRRNFQPERCMSHIALCYLDAGHEAYLKDQADEAQRLWDEGLRWARNRSWRRLFWTNKAAVYGLEHQYQLAEEALRRLIAEDPQEPSHEKNLGLTLGFQNRLKEALVHYDRARELCRTSEGAGLARANGNAWLRPAVIHGTLLEHEGDVRLAWRLFLEYRELFGDDYNFCLWFGDFAGAHGAYDVAWRFLERARDLRPNCMPAFQKLAQIAPRTKGTREELEVRTKAAAQAFADAQARAGETPENPAVAKICGGVADLSDIGLEPDAQERLAPDPLDGFLPDRPPPWVEAASRGRDPFVPFVPTAPEAPSQTPAAERGLAWPYVAAAAAVVAAAFLLLFRRPK
jgi:tetratricopeptide (TPR) repeat protein